MISLRRRLWPPLAEWSLLRWMLVALVIRLIAGANVARTWHPDEWFQTVEFGHFLAFGFLSQSGEFLVHLRNLTWPQILAWQMSIAHFFFEGNIFARFLAVKWTTGVLDLAILWGLAQQLREPFRQLRAPWVAYALVIFSSSLVHESVRPSQEHLSAIAAWVMLGWMAKKPHTGTASLLAGFFAVLTGAFRFASGLFGCGALLIYLWRVRSWVAFAWTILGISLGLFFGGLADWVHYGRPWEGLWMYLQFNVFTGLSKVYFGAQPGTVYWEYFRGMFGGVLLPAGIVVALLAPIGWFRSIRNAEPWAFAATCFMLGHLVIAHKEPRFMTPMAVFVLWAAYLGGEWVYDRFAVWHRVILSRWVRIPAIILLIANGALFVRAMWGDNFRVEGNYLELSTLLADNPNTCAVVSVRRPLTSLMPWVDRETVPSPAVGFFPTKNRENSGELLGKRPLIWVMHLPTCTSDQIFLLQPRRPEDIWKNDLSCEILPSGILKWAPRSQWDRLLRLKLVSAPWYRCPSASLARFGTPEIRTVIAKRMRRHASLPPYGVTGEEFMRMGWGELDPKDPANQDGTFGDW